MEPDKVNETMRDKRNEGEPLSPGKGRGGGKLWNAVRCAAFLALAAFIFIHVSYIVRQVPWRYNKETFTAFYAEEKNSLDVVTLGSSGCYMFFDNPYLYEKFGLTSFNLSVPLMPSMAASYVMDEVELTQSPQLYVVEARFFIRKPGKRPNRALYLLTDSMNYGINKLRMIIRGYPSMTERVQAFIDLCKYHGYWSGVRRGTLAFWDNKKKSPMKTWRNRAKVMPLTGPEIRTDLTPLPLEKSREAELRSLLEECRKKGRQVLFVATPYVFSENYARRKLSMMEIVESYGYHFLDLTDGEAYGIDYSTDFWDERHSNYRGAEKVTNALGEYIEKEYNIHAEHTKTAEADWENCVRLSNEQIRDIRNGEAESGDKEDA